MAARIPAVEVAHHGDRLGVGRPHAEMGRVAEPVRAELFVEAAVRALAEQVQIVPAQGRKLVGYGWHGGLRFSTCWLGHLPRRRETAAIDLAQACKRTTFSASSSKISTSAAAWSA